MTWRDTAAHSNHRWLLNEAKDIINENIKSQFDDGEITSPYENGSWLDVIQVFDYTKDCWNDNTVNQELFSLIIKIKIYDIPADTARFALKFIASYIINTGSISYWCRPIYSGNLKYVLQRYFPLHKPLNYDYLRYVLNYDILVNQEERIPSTAQ